MRHVLRMRLVDDQRSRLRHPARTADRTPLAVRSPCTRTRRRNSPARSEQAPIAGWSVTTPRAPAAPRSPVTRSPSPRAPHPSSPDHAARRTTASTRRRPAPPPPPARRSTSNCPPIAAAAPRSPATRCASLHSRCRTLDHDPSANAGDQGEPAVTRRSHGRRSSALLALGLSARGAIHAPVRCAPRHADRLRRVQAAAPSTSRPAPSRSTPGPPNVGRRDRGVPPFEGASR